MNLLPAIFGFGGGEFFASLRSAERTKQPYHPKTRLFVLPTSGIGYHSYQRYRSYHPLKSSFALPYAVLAVDALPQCSQHGGSGGIHGNH